MGESSDSKGRTAGAAGRHALPSGNLEVGRTVPGPPSFLRVLLDAKFRQQLIAVNSLIPSLMMLYYWQHHDLGVNPVEFVTRTTGVLALLFLVLTLLVTPLRKLAKWNWLAPHRRMLGLFAFFYATAHLLTYVVFDRAFDVASIPADVWKRPFIALGMVAFLLMVPLAATSNNAMIKRLGGRTWTRLHRLTYVCAIAGAAHYWLIVKSDITYPAVFASIIVILLGYRAIAASRR